MIKNYITTVFLAFICAMSITHLSAQEKTEKYKIVVVEKVVDADGNVTEKQIVKEGAEAKALMEEMEKEGENTWISKNGDEIDLSGKKHKMITKEQMRIKTINDDGIEKVIEWDGEGEMPDEMKELMKKEGITFPQNQENTIDVEVDMEDAANTEKKIIRIKKNENGEEELMEFELEGDEIPDDVQKILDEHGIDLKSVQSDNEQKKVIKIMRSENGDNDEMPEDIQKILDEHGIDLNSLETKEGQKKVIKIMKDGNGEDEVMEYELKGDEMPEDVQKILDEHGIDLDNIQDVDGDKKVIKIIKKEERGSSKKGQLGVLIENHPDGVLVTEVMEDSGAQEAGIQKGDVINAVNGEEVTTLQELVQAIKDHKANDTVKIDFLRENENQSKDVVLKEKLSVFEFETWDEVMDKGKVTKEIRIEKEIIKEKR